MEPDGFAMVTVKAVSDPWKCHSALALILPYHAGEKVRISHEISTFWQKDPVAHLDVLMDRATYWFAQVLMLFPSNRCLISAAFVLVCER